MPYPSKPCPAPSSHLWFLSLLLFMSYPAFGKLPHQVTRFHCFHRTSKKNAILRRGSGEIYIINMWKVIRTEYANKADRYLWVLASGKHLGPVFPLWEFGAGIRSTSRGPRNRPLTNALDHTLSTLPSLFSPYLTPTRSLSLHLHTCHWASLWGSWSIRAMASQQSKGSCMCVSCSDQCHSFIIF